MAYTIDPGGGSLFNLPKGSPYLTGGGPPKPKITPVSKLDPWAVKYVSSYDPTGGAGQNPPQTDPNARQITPSDLGRGAPVVSPAPSGSSAATTTTTSGGTTTAPAANWDPRTDPFVANLLNTQRTGRATTGAQLAQQTRDLLVGFGSKELANAILAGNPYSVAGDQSNPMATLDPFLNLVSDDPYNSVSTLGQENWGYLYGGGPLGQGSNIGTIPFNEAENAANLWYGGGRQFGLGQAARAHQLNVGQETRDTQANLAALSKQWLDYLGTQQSDLTSAESDAYTRHLTSGPGTSGGTDGGTGGGGAVTAGGPGPAPTNPNAPSVTPTGAVNIPTIVDPSGTVAPVDTSTYSGPNIQQTVVPWDQFGQPAGWAEAASPAMIKLLNTARMRGGKGMVLG